MYKYICNRNSNNKQNRGKKKKRFAVIVVYK